MKRYIKNNTIKHRNEIVIVKNNKQYICPSEEMLLAEGWAEYKPVVSEPTEEDLLQQNQANLKDVIINYDSSNEINIFYVNQMSMWLDKVTRSGLMLRFQSELAMGKTETSLWYNGLEFVLPLETAIQMLYEIEVYASACYDNTQRHISEVCKLTDIEAVKMYDYTLGYPDKLYFTF